MSEHIAQASVSAEPPSRSQTKTRLMLMTIGMFWLSVVSVGLWIMLNYETSPGLPATPPMLWPADSPLQRIPGRATLVMLAHPQCPCTRASLRELELLMARCQGRVTAYVVFFKPTDFPDRWERTDLWRSAAAIPGVQVLRDEGGIEADRFQAATSGQAVLYDAEGRLLFSGGITGSRGHSGDNAGRDAIVSLLTTGAAERTETLVFGCSLHEADSKQSSCSTHTQSQIKE